MAPEKIYVTKSIYGNTMMQVADEESLEYIRKDTFLAWAMEQEKLWFDKIACSNDDYDCGRAESYTNLIEKLNSL